MFCVVFYLLNYLCCLIKKKIQIKIKNVCVFFVHGQSVFPKKIILDLITSLLNLANLANIKTNRKINSWELTVNFR